MKYYEIKKGSGSFLLHGTGMEELSNKLHEVERDFVVREIDLTFSKEKLFSNQVRSSNDAYKFIREVLFDGLEVQEHFVVLYMNQANRITGYYRHSKGTINSTQVDIQMIAAVALKTLSKAMVISHNHPSGNTEPSEADRRMTRRLRDAVKPFDIHVLDHIIATKNSYYSFADNNESSLAGIAESDPVKQMRRRIFEALKAVTKANSPVVFERIQTKEGYAKLETEILERCLRENRIPEAIIPQIEMQWT